MGNNIYSERIGALRSLMADKGWDAVVVSGSDPHGSEYPAARWKQVEWLSGFTGEAGDVVVTAEHAGLWTDSRYFIQADMQLEGTGIELHKTRIPGAVGIPEWIAACLGREEGVFTVAVDGICQSVGGVQEIKEAIGSMGHVIDVPDMLEAIWEDRPEAPVTPVTTLDVECFGGIPRVEKLSWLRKWMLLEGVDRVLLSSLDEIAWILNVRGEDIDYNPLVISWLLVSQESVKWFVRKPGLSPEAPDTTDSYAELEADGVTIEDYDALLLALSDFSGDTGSVRIFVDPSTLNHNVYAYICRSYSEENVICGTSPVILEKAVKTASEIENLRLTYKEDGVAVERFLYWLEKEVASGRVVTEWEASQKLTSLRSEIPGYRGNSFENISAYGPNAALPHYSTPEEGSAPIRPYGLYLVDSGGQYLTGTTDITRTVPMGECSLLEKEDYTLVLRGMIELSMAVFPYGTSGCQIDAVARMALWRAKRNFGHGTGHGIGYYLCVHEGPQSIRQNHLQQPLLPGMVTSNEPGLYREGKHGIRHENVVLCREAGESEFGRWLEFETLTCCHIDTSAVIPELLSPETMRWLNAYNDRVFRTLAPFLSPEETSWLQGKCAPLAI